MKPMNIKPLTLAIGLATGSVSVAAPSLQGVTPVDVDTGNSVNIVASETVHTLMAADGSGAYVWKESDNTIAMRPFNSNDGSLGTAIVIGTAPSQVFAATIDDNGNVLLANVYGTGGPCDLEIIRVAKGAASGSNLVATEDISGSLSGGASCGHEFVDIAADSDGDFVVVRGNNNSGGTPDIRIRTYSSAGVQQGSQLTLATSYFPVVGMNNNGNFAVAYRDSAAFPNVVEMQRFSSLDTSTGSNVGVNITNTSDVTGSFDVEVDDDGDALLLYTTTDGLGSSESRLINVVTVPVGGTANTPVSLYQTPAGVTRVAGTTDGKYYLLQDLATAIDVDANGDALLSWVLRTQTTDKDTALTSTTNELFVRRYNEGFQAVDASPVLINTHTVVVNGIEGYKGLDVALNRNGNAAAVGATLRTDTVPNGTIQSFYAFEALPTTGGGNASSGSSSGSSSFSFLTLVLTLPLLLRVALRRRLSRRR